MTNLAARLARLRVALVEALARRRARIAEALARSRVALGFVSGAIVLALARPTPTSLGVGMSIAACGEGLRVWAAGHLNKAREVTSSGPYRWLAHPLYMGSSIMGVGLAIASAHIVAAALIAIYLVTTLPAAIKTEEAFLRGRFGDRYDRYRRGGEAAPNAQRPRRFSASRAIANREHRAVIGFAVAVLLLVLKATYNGVFWRAGGP
ncbi:MAG: isoprenylcysteine carboxylmethyltransferase family protein [Acidobacteria bacterium]|nr:isoprenylcysteine carboxylmethyltransferase family protein [Acidobacteriota bacterium]